MPRSYTIRTKINKPVATVFKAVSSKEHIIKYFSERASDDLIEGETVVWYWDGYGDHPVRVTKVIENELIEFVLSSLDWQKSADDSYEITVRIGFEELDANSTMVSISESGWIESEDALKGSYDNCEGWTHMAMCLKAYLEYGIDLR